MSIQYGDWKVIQIIGSGAFGTVYEIRRETLGFVQTAALKVISIPQSQRDADALRSTGMDEASIGEYYKELAAQLMNELRTMEQLKGHTNIVSYEDHEIRKKANGIGWDLYIRMELLTPLSKYMLAHSMGREEIIRLGIDLCRALERCESLNIIHRDIKPDNIFISKMGDGKLGDFGIARTVERTMSGLSQKGTYGYMAPEIYLGQPYGKTVDIYSLGLVLYKLLNYNRGPFLPAYPNPIRFQDQEQALVRRIRGEQLPAPVQADRRLAEVVLKACSADPGRRYATAGEMGRALLAVAGNEERAGAQSGNYVQRVGVNRNFKGQQIKRKHKKRKRIVLIIVLIAAVGLMYSGVSAAYKQLKQMSGDDLTGDYFLLEASETLLYMHENETRTIYITAASTDHDENIILEKGYDAEYLDVEWGEWDGDILPVTVTLKNYKRNYEGEITFCLYRYEGDPLRKTVEVVVLAAS